MRYVTIERSLQIFHTLHNESSKETVKLKISKLVANIPLTESLDKLLNCITLHGEAKLSQLTFTCSRSTIQLLEKSVKYVQS